ncbi:MAG: hypothetical protein GY906_15100 [bacterium]|nr:hypothetical protein [bacterium]
MRELAKSMMRFSWAMSLFGMDQLSTIVSKDDDDEKSQEAKVTSSFDEVSSATGSNFSSRAQNLYESGDKFQGEVVDVFFDFFSADSWSPREVLNRAADFAESSADALRRAADDESSESEDESAAS